MKTSAQDSIRIQDGKVRKRWVEEQSVFIFRVAYTLIDLLARFWIRRFGMSGVENVPHSGGAFLIANHTSALDPFILGYAVSPRMLRGPGKIELFGNPMVSWLMRRLGIFPIRQHVADAAAVRTMVELYRSGGLVAIHPEGGRSDDGILQPFFPDFARLMIRLKAPLIPAAISGARDALPIGSLIPRPNTAVALVVGEPFDLSQYVGRELTAEVALEAAEVMRARVADLLPAAERLRLSLQR